MTVREDEVERADGSRGIYGVVHKPDFAVAVPYDDGGFWLVEQFRYPVRRRTWEFPQGSWPGARGTPEELARAELAEETGLVPASMEHLGHVDTASGYCSQGFDVFLATELSRRPPEREPSESDMRERFIHEDELVEWIASGRMVDAASLAAYSLFLLHRR